MAWMPSYAGAQSLEPATQVSDDAAALSFEIPAQPLSAALVNYAKISGIRLAYDTRLTKGLATRGLSGRYTAQQALGKLLDDTKLTYRFTGERVVTILSRTAANANAQSLELPTIDVRGDTEKGYVATNSGVGTKTNTPLLETPQSISVVTRDQMDAQGVQTVPQALRYTPGVFAEPRGVSSTGQEFGYARGFTMNDKFLDGMKLLKGEYGIAQIDPYFLERIEFVRGPASVLYGQNSPGGMLNLVSKRPTSQPLHEIETSIGSHNLKQLAFDFGGPLDTAGKFSYRLTGLARDAKSQVDFNGEQRVEIAPAFKWEPQAGTSFTLLTNYQRDPKGGAFAFVPAAGSYLPNPNGKISTSFFMGDPNWNKYDRTQATIGYLFEHAIDSTWTVRQNLRYKHLDSDVQGLYQTVLGADQRTLSRYGYLDREKIDALTTDNQIQAVFNTGPVSHKVIGGLDYQRNRFDQVVGFQFAGVPAIDLFSPVYGRTIPNVPVTGSTLQTTNQVGLYVQDQIKFDRWALTLGGRQDYARSQTDNRLANSTTNTSDNAFTGRAGLVYLFDNGLAPYVSYSESFEPTTGTDFFGSPFKPTTGKQYEAGVKFQPRGFNSFTTLSVYDLTQRNVTTQDPVTSHGVNAKVQTGEIRSRGFEFEAHLSLADGLDMTAAYSYVDAKVTQSNSVDLGKHPIAIPQQTASMWADYTFQSGQLAGFGAGGGVRYIGTSYGNAANLYQVPTYTLFDAAIHYDFRNLGPAYKGWKLSVNAMNLADTTYVSSCAAAPTVCFYGTRRTVLATMKYKW